MIFKFNKAAVSSMSLALLLCLVSATSVQANVPLPAVNLGESGFEDGIAGPGLLFQETFSYYKSENFKDEVGNNLPGNNSVTTQVLLSHIAYFSEQKVFGAFYGAELLLPLVNVDLDTEFGLQKNTSQIGDITFSPLILQWTDTTLFGRPFWQRFNFSISLPTGNYDQYRDLNVGNNYISLNPHYAFTLQATEKYELSGRIHYLWNGKNSDPQPHVASESSQAGQAVHMNFAASYAVSQNWRIGLAGYYLKQFTEDKLNGAEVTGSKEKVFAIGPGVKYMNQGHSVNINLYSESGAENRTEGDKLTIRYSKVW